MVVLCEGKRGEGFYICQRCGAGFKRRQSSHKTPHGRECTGTLDRVSLGHEFLTDVLKLEFRIAPPLDTEIIWLALPLAYALAEGAATTLEIPSADLSATIVYSPMDNVLPPIILYDNVPGGAGLVAMLEDRTRLKACLEASLERVFSRNSRSSS